MFTKTMHRQLKSRTFLYETGQLLTDRGLNKMNEKSPK